MSRWVRDADGYIKPSVGPANFLEFTWADKFRRDLKVDFPLCKIDLDVSSAPCQQQIGELRADLGRAMASARAYDSVQWIQEGNCADNLQGNPQALVACGYNANLVDVDVNKYITADRGCETTEDYAWEAVTDGQPPGDTLAYFQYAQRHVTESHQICRVAEDGIYYAGVIDPQDGRCSHVDDDGNLSSGAEMDALTGVQGMYLWTAYTEEIAESDDDFFDDAISVGNNDKSDLGPTYVCAAGDRIGWVKKGKQKCHLSPDGLHVPFAVLTTD